MIDKVPALALLFVLLPQALLTQALDNGVGRLPGEFQGFNDFVGYVTEDNLTHCIHSYGI
jgi:hypothetical protein